MAEDAYNLTVVDVYDAAAVIGKDFELMIDNFGAEAVTELMPKVIRILEQLEYLASRNEKENNDVAELRMAIQRMEDAKADRLAEREKYEKELEQLEDTWRQEVKDLLSVVAKLQEDNRKLSGALQERDGQAARIEKNEEEEARVMDRLKETVDKQRQQIRSLERQMKQQNIDMEAMQEQVDRLSNVNTNIRRKTNLTRKQTQILVQEKVDLQAQLQEKEQQIVQIKQLLHEQDSVETPVATPVTSPTDDMERIEQKLHQLGKMVVDLKDPNRPRFTLHELRDVLLERNELKSKLVEVEEELQYYKPHEIEEDVLPVEGPINREPLEKLYPGYREESGIKRFFKTIFGTPKVTRKNQQPSNVTKGSKQATKTMHQQPLSRMAATVHGASSDTNTQNSQTQENGDAHVEHAVEASSENVS